MSACSLLDFEPSKFTQCTSPDNEPRVGGSSAVRGLVRMAWRRTNEHLCDAAVLSENRFEPEPLVHGQA